MIGECGYCNRANYRERLKRYPLHCGRLDRLFELNLSGPFAAVLSKPFGYCGGTIRVAAGRSPNLIDPELVALAAGVLIRTLRAETSADAGRNLPGDDEYKKYCGESFQHKPS
ncbi:MAG: hypothetical protein H0U23_01590 [Blastocatellia bacterium]|nr:hypothetical protein [Blastocatellia bacterium]